MLEHKWLSKRERNIPKGHLNSLVETKLRKSWQQLYNYNMQTHQQQADQKKGAKDTSETAKLINRKKKRQRHG